MDIPKTNREWIDACNAFDLARYLEFYLDEAVLDDTSVGQKFVGLDEISEYFESYFTGYHTHTSIRQLEVRSNNTAHLEVHFKGSFRQGEIGGTFEFTFKQGKIAYLKADLIH